MEILITGGHSGMGLELTKLLLRIDCNVHLIVRNREREADAIKAIGPSDSVNFYYADLSNQKAVKAVASEVSSKLDQLDGLFNNAGLLLDRAYYSKQGNEMQFEVNTLTPYILFTELSPLLVKAKKPFVVNTATANINGKDKLDIADLKSPRKFVKLMGSYMNSKFAMVLIMNYLAKNNPTIKIRSIDPGAIKTKMTVGSAMPFFLKPVRHLFFKSPLSGAKKLYAGAFGKEFSEKSGVYISGNRIKPLKKELTENEFDQIMNSIE
ncbi:MAG: SDR family NAD(P)-dependent oxidoreductase [Bacteroidota bacterium]